MFAEFKDLETKLRRQLTDVESDEAETLLDEALNLIRSRIPDMDARAEADEVFAAIVTLVQKNAVLRVLRNPEGRREESDEGFSVKVDLRVSSGVMEIMPKEWRDLGLDAGSGFLSFDSWRFTRGSA